MVVSRIWRCLAKSRGVWQNLEVFGRIWRCLARSRGVWQDLEVFGRIWRCLARSRGVWQDLEVFGRIWRCLARSRGVWHDLEPPLDNNMATLESMIVEDQREPEKPIDREKTCPLLLRVFCSNERHHALMEFSRGSTPTNELQIYTWMDATLKELTSLVKEVNPDARRKGTFFDFAIVFPDTRSPTFRMREIGTTCAGRKSPDDTVTLAQKKFAIGDYLDIAICAPRAEGRMPIGGRGRRQF
ncbi:Histone deacetylase complex subunit SAP18 [Bulinus truncatus]|nr:Histone deacetylase complex subunit SAP18 [Bulinus truncatus]